MGVFDHIQSEIETRDKKEGILPADLLELGPPLRKLMSHITRAGEVTALQAAQHIGETSAQATKMLNRLVEKGYLERERRGGGWVYRTRFAHTRGRDVPVGVWSALGKRNSEMK